MTSTPASLCQRIGGEEAVTATVGLFYEKVIADPDLAPFFANLAIDSLVKKQIAFMTMAFGGPHAYSGRDLRIAHAPLVSRGLGQRHFNLIAQHLESSLRELSVPAELVSEVLAVVGTTRHDVLAGPAR